MKIKLNTSLFMESPHPTARYFGGGTPIIMGGQTDAEMEARLNEAALENERMMKLAADEQLRLQRELDKRDEEMALSMQQRNRETEADLASAQRALDVELDTLAGNKAEDSLGADFSALEDALSKGLGGSSSDNVRPL